MVGVLNENSIASGFCLRHLPLLKEQSRELQLRFRGGGSRIPQELPPENLEKVARHITILTNTGATAGSCRQAVKRGGQSTRTSEHGVATCVR